MTNVVCLNVNGRQVLSTDITYDDLVWLYINFKNTYGKLPTTNDGKAKYNMPQQRIIRKVIQEKGITFNDFMLQFGKVGHVRTESKDYDLFLKKYKDVCNSTGRALMQKELINNHYGLPNAAWFVKYCPNKSVKSFDDFVLWCGFDSNKLKKDNELVAEKLIQLEKTLGRPITGIDITLENVGFTPIVVSRIWGNLGNAKKELGLKETIQDNAKPFSFYEEKLLHTLDKIFEDKNRKFIAWSDIENPKYNEFPTEHKTYMRAFKKVGIDFFAYLKQYGYEMNYGSRMGNTHTFDDGEKTTSIYEYDFSRFIKEELHMQYKIDYCRDVLYKTFANIKSKSNCDYVININGNLLYVEIAGVIYNTKSDNWKEAKYKTKIENEYREKMIFKEGLLLKYNKPFLFLFPWDMLSGKYKEKLKEFIQENVNQEVT
jgi:hypothetical protein